MPQVDKATFLPIVISFALLFITGYLYLNVTHLFTLIGQVKLLPKRQAEAASALLGLRSVGNNLGTAPFFSSLTQQQEQQQ